MFKGRFRNFSIIFFVLYLMMVVIPGLVVYPLDFIFGWVSGAGYVDGWTQGIMIYFYLIFVLPFVYLILLFFFYLYSLTK